MTSNTTSRSLILVGLLLVSAVGAFAVAGTVAAQNASNGTSNDTGMGMDNGSNVSIMAEPDSAGATANHTVNLTVPEAAADNLTGVAVDYNGTNASVVAVPANVLSVSLNNQSIVPNASVRTLGSEVVNTTFDLNQSVSAGDNISMVYQAGNPPEAGNYTIDVRANPGNDPVNMTATLDISEGNGSTTEDGMDMGGAGENQTIMADPDSAGATANHTVSLTLPEAMGSNLTGVAVNYSGSNASIVQVPANVFSVSLNDQDIVPNASVRALNGELVNVTFDLNQSVSAGDQLSMVYQAGNPPEAGNYTIDMQVNPEGEAANVTGTLDISEGNQTTTIMEGGMDNGTTMEGGMDNGTTEEGGMDSGTTEEGGMDTETTEESGMDTETTEESGMDSGTTEEADNAETTTSSGNGPGFTAIAALVGVLAAALLATRRN